MAQTSTGSDDHGRSGVSTKLTLVLPAVVALVLGLVSQASAQVSDIQIVELNCNSDPELVVIQNVGDVSQDLTGWELQSDLLEDETFDLSGVLQPGDSASIILGNQSLFRDDDPADFARIVDDAGAFVHEVNCSGEAPPEAVDESPDPVLGTSSDPPLLSNVPNGGGSPPPAGDFLSPIFVIAIGGSMIAVSVAVLALPRLASARAPGPSQPTTFPLLEEAATSTAYAQGKGQPKLSKRAPRHLASGVAVAGLATVMAVAVLAWRRRA